MSSPGGGPPVKAARVEGDGDDRAMEIEGLGGGFPPGIPAGSVTSR